MKKLLAALVIIISATSANAADKYVFDAAHTNVIWFANHFGYSQPFGYFTDIGGSIAIDEKKPENSSIDVTIKTASLTTPVEKFTNHLKSKDFFEVEKYPEAKFKSTKVEVTGKDTAKVTGDLTLHGVTKPVVLNVRLNSIGKQPMTQKQTAGFSAETTIKRSDFGMSYGLPGVGDDVKLVIETETVLATEADAKK